MKKIILLFVLLCTLSLHSQTDDQIVEWVQKGQSAEEQQHYQDAIHYFELARNGLATRFGRGNDTYIKIVDKLSTYYAQQGNYIKAAERKTEIVNFIRNDQGTNNISYATQLGFLANYQSQAGDNDKAIELGGQAVDIVRDIIGTDNITYATLVSNMAVYNDRINNFAKALELEGEAMRIKRRLVGKNHTDYALSLNNMALYNAHLGNYKKALDLGMRALEIFRNAHGENHFDCATTYDNISTFLFHYGQLDKAIASGTKAADIYRNVVGEHHPDYAASLNNLATYYAATGDYQKAIELGAKTVEIQMETLGVKHPAVASSLDNFAGYYADLGNCAKAMEMGDLAMSVYKEIYGEQHPDYALSLANLASYAAQSGDYTKALQYVSQSVAILQDNTLRQFACLPAARRTDFWTKNAHLFTNVYPSFAFLAKVQTAADLYNKSALFAKGLLLSTELEVRRLIQESGDAEALQMLDALQNGRRQLQTLNTTPIDQRYANADSLARVINRQERLLIKRSQAFGDFTNRLRTTWQDIQQVLKDDEVAIEFLAFDLWNSDKKMLAALTLRKDDEEPKFIPLFEQQQLQSVSDTQYYNCPELTTLVWQPLQNELKDIRRIYFSPAGVLHNIGIEYAPGMERFDMFRLSTTREIIDMKTPAAQSRKVGKDEVLASLFGGIDYGTTRVTSISAPYPGTDAAEAQELSESLHRAFVDSLPMRGFSAKYLPSSLTEVETIQASFDKKHHVSNIHTGAKATESSVKSISTHAPHILHIATHGFYFTEQQVGKLSKLRFVSTGYGLTAAEIEDKALTRSGLLFAGANNTLKGQAMPMGADDGILTAQEISRLDLRGLDLVVLSACKTGNGDINQGEGVFGLQRGFKKAGAQSLIMSLWEVADEATQILMTSFYDNILLGQPKRVAFHNAQQHLRAVNNGLYDHPQFWAAFILLD
ncbi:MAG: CHAT domain-containing protein [Prevotella sp.]|nr:CHAT domain-containing protein [Prevotella sp.]